jgi:hypothetical protein
MPDKKMVSSKMGSRTVQRIEDYAEREGISKSQAVERMVKQGLDVEESDMRLIPVQTDGGTRIENQLSSVEDSIKKQSEKIESQSDYQELLAIAMLVSLAWIGLHLIFDGFGPAITSLTGIPLIGLLTYLLYKSR